MNTFENFRKENEEPTQPSSQSSCLGSLIYIACIGWLFASALGRNFTTFFASTNPGPASSKHEWIASLAHALMLFTPLIPLSLVKSNIRFRKVYQAWLWSAFILLALSPIFFFRVEGAQAMAAAQIGGMFLVLLVLLRQRKLIYTKTTSLPSQTGTMQKAVFDANINQLNNKSFPWRWYLAGSLGLLALTPWFSNGALGSFLDSFLFGILAVELSLATVLLIEIFIWLPTQRLNCSEGKCQYSFSDFFLASTGAAGILLILANAAVFPFGSMYFLLMIICPIIGWILTAFWMLDKNGNQPQTSGTSTSVPKQNATGWKGPAWLLLALVLSGPLLLIDADELAIVINMSRNEVLPRAFSSAGVSFLISLGFAVALAGLIIWNNHKKTNLPSKLSQNIPKFLFISLSLVSASIFTISVFSGQPGFYGERMLVILKDQANVSQAGDISDYSSRRATVYRQLVQYAQTSQTDIRRFFEKWHIAYTPYYLLNAIEVKDSPLLRLYLKSRPDVDRILNSPHLRPLPEAAPNPITGKTIIPSPENLWSIKMIQADKVWQEFGITGRGIIIGQSDSGVQGDHPELTDQYRGKDNPDASLSSDDYNWFDPWNHSASPVDLGGHGTHTLGTILGKNTGIAPDAQWIGCVNLARNLGNPAYYLDCMQFMLAPFPQNGDPFTQGEPALGAHVLNNSWGCPEFEGCDPQVFLPVVEALQSAGVFVVASAGNDGPACSTIDSPLSLYADVFTVGAVDEQGNLTSFSSLGPVTIDGSQRIKPDLIAPGEQILSSLPGSTYGTLSGTSMAGPHIAGVVALLWSANPALIGDIDATQKILTQSAQLYAGLLPDCPGAQQLPSSAFGYGILDAYSAVKMAIQTSPK